MKSKKSATLLTGESKGGPRKRNAHLPDESEFQKAIPLLAGGLINEVSHMATQYDCCEACLIQQVILNLLLNCEAFCHPDESGKFLRAVEHLARALIAGESPINRHNVEELTQPLQTSLN